MVVIGAVDIILIIAPGRQGGLVPRVIVRRVHDPQVHGHRVHGHRVHGHRAPSPRVQVSFQPCLQNKDAGNEWKNDYNN